MFDVVYNLYIIINRIILELLSEVLYITYTYILKLESSLQKVNPKSAYVN